MSRLPVVGVVVPVHDEQDLLGGCLDALGRAARWVGERAVVRTVVVLDACRDASADIARLRGVEITTGPGAGVGRARDAGCRSLLDGPGPRPDWLATTDADSRVPPDWLLAHLEASERGDDAFVGTVYIEEPDEELEPTGARRWFREVYDASGDPHPHVHGANLGVRAGAYEAVGGFRGIVTGEDVALVAALEAHGSSVHRTRRSPVLTSGRRVGRATGGLAHRLVELDAQHVRA
jgi:GT2 family glycosyltransferase